MALTRQRKSENIEALRAHAAEARALFGIDYKGLGTAELTAIRRSFRADQFATLMVAKNTLSAVAFQNTAFAGCSESSKGNILYVFALTEPPLVARRLIEYSREYENFVPKFALFDGRLCDEKGFEAISRLPTRDIALAQLLSVVQAPVGALARTLNEIPARFVRLMDAVARQKS